MNIQINVTESETLIQVNRERTYSYPSPHTYQNMEIQIIQMSLE